MADNSIKKMSDDSSGDVAAGRIQSGLEADAYRSSDRRNMPCPRCGKKRFLAVCLPDEGVDWVKCESCGTLMEWPAWTSRLH